jgi:hypothetical protein
MFCIQCSMKALVEGKGVPWFVESPEEHMQRCHPDPEATQRERKELEAKLKEMQDAEKDPDT